MDPLLIVREFTVVFDDWDVNVESHPPCKVKSLDELRVRASS